MSTYEHYLNELIKLTPDGLPYYIVDVYREDVSIKDGYVKKHYQYMYDKETDHLISTKEVLK